jgi:glycosyltransferase involved in cell wall biosynthesis
MANILYIPQMSMYDKQTMKLTPEADGNINMMRNTINEWRKYRKDDYFYILLPRELQNNFQCGIFANRTLLFYDSYTVSARYNRFNFPMKEISNVIKNIPNIDILINDVIELTGNFKSLFDALYFGKTPKIISNIRHLDDKVNYSYFYRVLDGIEQSDLVTILSESMKENLINQIFRVVNLTVKALRYKKKIHVFEPSVSQNELLGKYTLYYERSEKVTILFPGRLSKGEERRTNWDKFIEAINKLRSKRQDFEVIFTDPNNSINMGLKKSDAMDNWIFAIPKNRVQFINTLAKSDIVVSLMDTEGFGGISIREALLYGCRPVIPYVHEYKKMANKNHYGFIKSPIDVDELVDALNISITMGKKKRGNEFEKLGMQFTVEEQFKSLLPKLEEIING